MTRWLFAAALLVATPVASAAVPVVEARCPGDLAVRADASGVVTVNGREAKLKAFNENYYEARDPESGTIVSLTRAADGSVSVSYTGKGRANGMCTVLGR